MPLPHPNDRTRRSRRATAALAIALALAVGCSSKRKRIDPATELELYKETANVFYTTGDYERAEAQALKGLEVDRRDVPLRLMLGWIALQRGDTPNLMRAEKIFREVLDDRESNNQARMGLAETLERLGVVHSESAAAIASGESLPRRGTPEQRAAELEKRATELWREAVSHYQATVRERGGSLRALNGLQRTHSLLGEYETSLSYAQSVLELARIESEDFRRLVQRGNLRAEQELALRASEARSRTLSVDTHLLASELLVRLERDREALAHLDAALEVNPGRVDALGRRAELRLAEGDFSGAIADIDTLLARSAQLPYEHPDIRRAYDLRAEAERGRARQRVELEGAP